MTTLATPPEDLLDPPRRHRTIPVWLAVVAASLPMFMATLDNLVMTTALPVVQAGGGILVDNDDVSPDWVSREIPHCCPTTTDWPRCRLRPPAPGIVTQRLRSRPQRSSWRHNSVPASTAPGSWGRFAHTVPAIDGDN